MVVVWLLGLLGHHTWLVGAGLIGLGLGATADADRATAPYALVLTVNLMLACLANGLMNGLPRFLEVIAWAAWPLLATTLTPLLPETARTGPPLRPVATWLGRALPAGLAFVLAAALRSSRRSGTLRSSGSRPTTTRSTGGSSRRATSRPGCR
jgi:hypothetical protein